MSGNDTTTRIENPADLVAAASAVDDKTLNEQEREEVAAMLEAGVHFGHKRSHWNPTMAPFIYTIRKELYIIDVRKTERMLQEACQVLEDTIARGGSVMIVGTHPAAMKQTTEFAEDLDLFYVTLRWIGGTLTNFKTISQRTKYMREMEEKREKGELEKYTKREQLEFDEEIRKLNEKMGGIKRMRKLPDLVVIMSVAHDDLAVAEVQNAGIEAIGIVDTNADPTAVDYPVPANDDTPAAVSYMLERFRTAVERGRERASAEAPDTTSTEEDKTDDDGSSTT